MVSWLISGSKQKAEVLQMSQKLHWVGLSVLAVALAPASFAADANRGKALAKRWCTACHVVERDQTAAIDHAPPFSSVAKTPDFDENRLAFLLLRPHPNMPRLVLSRSEVADLASYIETLK
jgi:mono/diheme cytochrome c family protein